MAQKQIRGLWRVARDHGVKLAHWLVASNAVWDLLALFGVLLTATGLAWIHWPTAVMFMGAVLLAVGLLGARLALGPARPRQEDD
jgi:hypothetical protein